MSSEHNKLVSLLDLLDDETEEVKKEVMFAFENYGLMLENDLSELGYFLSDFKLNPIKEILEKNRRMWLKLQWSKVILIEDEFLQLERALELLIKFDYGIVYNPNLEERIRQLSFKYLNENSDGNVLDLANFLFIAEEIGRAHV